MRHLYLLRHAKSSWSDSSLHDIERPLNDRGRDAAPRIGHVLAEREARPTVVLCSPSLRTRETTELVLAAAKLDAPVQFEERIYAATPERLLEVIAEVDDKHSSLMLVGHNPGIEELLTHFVGEQHHVPTAALAALTLDAESWRDIHVAGARLDWLVKPRDLQPSGQNG